MYYTRALAHLKSMWFSSVANSILWFAFLKVGRAAGGGGGGVMVWWWVGCVKAGLADAVLPGNLVATKLRLLAHALRRNPHRRCTAPRWGAGLRGASPSRSQPRACSASQTCRSGARGTQRAACVPPHQRSCLALHCRALPPSPALLAGPRPARPYLLCPPRRDVWVSALFFIASVVCLGFGLAHFFRGPLDTPLAISLIFMIYNIIPQFLLLQVGGGGGGVG